MPAFAQVFAERTQLAQEAKVAGEVARAELLSHLRRCAPVLGGELPDKGLLVVADDAVDLVYASMH